MQEHLMTVAVYLGSAGSAPKWRDFAFSFGKALAERGIRVVYGGANVGTMASLADGVIDGKGQITGVFPAGFGGKRDVAAQHRDIIRRDLSEFVEVRDFAERKDVMCSMSDCCIALPGSYGTMDELFCYAVGNEIGHHDKISYVMNVDGFYDGLETQIERAKAEGFIGVEAGMIVFVHSMEEFFALLGV